MREREEVGPVRCGIDGTSNKGDGLREILAELCREFGVYDVEMTLVRKEDDVVWPEIAMGPIVTVNPDKGLKNIAEVDKQIILILGWIFNPNGLQGEGVSGV
eukprot:gnl/Trimastix_PCT/1302.p2 GENE.gnl/Trimastix_PCT/1302~~gnl/Trimastix_PCT/1302.p2  ORF type:complete len:114 (+),score=5.88 gnl/Trimastix_PCT/1302:37-342(+)